MTTGQYELTQLIHEQKYFVGSIFVVEGDSRKFFATKIFPSAVDELLTQLLATNTTQTSGPPSVQS